MQKIRLMARSNFKILAHLVCVSAGMACICTAGFAATIFEDDFVNVRMDTYLRTDVVSFNNVVDLDSTNKDDATTYAGIDYSLGFGAEWKERGPKFYLKLERNGPYDYSAPLFVHNTLMTSGGVIEEYRNDELLPQAEEFWFDTPLTNTLRFKAGLYTHDVGEGFSLNGSYENFGCTLYQEFEHVAWRIYYCRPDLVYKNHLGPRIRQEEEQGIRYEHNAANFFSTDVRFTKGERVVQPYAGVLADYTSPEKRDNLFAAPVKKDLLGTLGLYWKEKVGGFTFNTEAARNFGKAASADEAFEDMEHAGYFLYQKTEYCLGKFIPSLQFLLCSGNKASLDMALNQDVTLASGKNRAFSIYSPLNRNLGDSISSLNCDARPIIAMGCGNGLDYGVPRPGTFAVSDFDNLLMPSAGVDINITEALFLELYGYYLRSFNKGVGMLEGEPKRLSAELGYEIDAIIDYRINKNLLISFLGGYFIPGRYYKEQRDDTQGSLLSPFVRGDGKPNPAYQVELAMEFTF